MRNLFKKPLMLLLFITIFSMAISGSVYAHKAKNDSKHDDYKSSLDVATAVTMIVKGLNLNIDNIRFFKAPKASDYYTKVNDNASYANDFIIAQFNGLELSKDINPSSKVTREQFAKWLFGALSHTGDYAWIEIFQVVSDANKVSDGYMDSIQKLLIAKIITTDSQQRINPKSKVTQKEATTMINRTVKFIASKKSSPIPESQLLKDVDLILDKESDAVTKVTVSATVPHPGYGIEITGIQFSKGEAHIQYKVLLPDPNLNYIQVISQVKAVTYIPSTYKAVLEGKSSSSFDR